MTHCTKSETKSAQGESMNREDVIRLARETGLAIAYAERDEDGWQELERFAALVAAAEREACAQACDKLVDQEIRTGKVDHNEMPWTMYCANIIRARGKE